VTQLGLIRTVTKNVTKVVTDIKILVGIQGNDHDRMLIPGLTGKIYMGMNKLIRSIRRRRRSPLAEVGRDAVVFPNSILLGIGMSKHDCSLGIGRI
jgi:hypothetical protein